MKVCMLTIFLFLGLCASAKVYDPKFEDPCSHWPTCNECVNATYCGWCEVEVVYVDGTNGTHCASVNKTQPENQWQCPSYFQTISCKNPLYSWICNNRSWICEQTSPGNGVPIEECKAECLAPTYICDNETIQCVKSTPGKGTSLPVCEAECGKPAVPATSSPQTPAQTYECDNQTYTCVRTTPGHGTSLSICLTECKAPPKPYECDPIKLVCFESQKGVPKPQCDQTCGRPSNVTPHDLIGVWRGFQISANYFKGEWNMKIKDNGDVSITKPDGTTFASGTIGVYGTELWIVASDGDHNKRIRSIYSIMTGPETNILTWAMGNPGELPPKSFDDGMYIGHGHEFVFIDCLDPLHCKFSLTEQDEILERYAAKLKSLKRKYPNFDKLQIVQDSSVDECEKWPNCSICVQQQTCGWCSIPVIYEGGDVGKQCAGWNVDQTKRPFVCPGVYSIIDCSPPPPPPTPPPAPTYLCNETGLHCYQTSPGHGTSFEVCNATCGHPIIPSNSTPGDLRGVWRGLQIQNGYLSGEWTLKVPEGLSNVITIVDPFGTTV
eukprot:TRINITY_DN364_c0_g2_i1.p1 TRINITY_DN364_c0_g2~~TRINITY_DN364_c0_g2_i1.p1  ORF type:complete len:550 (-),score=69.51 TRINITY_DN364_c0_g2_i1:362-2011(-)